MSKPYTTGSLERALTHHRVNYGVSYGDRKPWRILTGVGRMTFTDAECYARVLLRIG